MLAQSMAILAPGASEHLEQLLESLNEEQTIHLCRVLYKHVNTTDINEFIKAFEEVIPPSDGEYSLWEMAKLQDLLTALQTFGQKLTELTMSTSAQTSAASSSSGVPPLK